jgi:ABC-type lipoprotein release transport system permease subunit
MVRLLRDLRFAARRLIAQPGFTLTAVLTLALAVGVNALMLDVLDRLLVRDPSGVRDPKRSVASTTAPPRTLPFPRRTTSALPTFRGHWEWRVYATAAVLMMIVAALAAWIPARRAAAVDPTALLRSE